MNWFQRLSKGIQILIVSCSVVFALIFIALAVAPNIATKYINDHGNELCGRKLYVDDIDVNYFTGGISIESFTMFEPNEKDTFCGFNNFYVNIELFRTVFSDLAISKVQLDQPKIKIIQADSGFNFDDIITFFNSSDSVAPADTTEESFAYFIDNLSINNAKLEYTLTEYNSTIGLESIFAKCPAIHSDDPNIVANITTDFRHGGHGSADIHVNLDESRYAVSNLIDSLNLIFLEPVLKGFMNISTFNGRLSSDLLISGSYENTDILSASGEIDLYGFNMIDSENKPILSTEYLTAGIDSIILDKSVFDFGTIKIDSFYSIYEMYPNGSNFDKLIKISSTEADSSSTIESAEYDPYEDESIYEMIARYVRTYFTDYNITAYEIESLDIDNSAFVFKDYTLEEPFSYNVDQIHLTGKDLNSKNDRISFDASCLLNDKGDFKGVVSINPKDFMDLEINYTIDHFVVDDFTSHSKFYVAHPILSGEMKYDCKLVLKDGMITNTNYITIDEFYFGNKNRSGALYDLPVKLAASLLKDNKGVITLDIPVSGDINDPEFNIWKIVWGIIKNLIIKIVAAPYKLISGWFDGNEDAAKQINCEYKNSQLGSNASKTISGLSKLFKDKPELVVNFYQLADSSAEFELLAVEQMKKDYLLSKGITEVSNEQLNELSVHDTSFVFYLNTLTSDFDTITPPQQKCVRLADKKHITSTLSELRNGRNNNLKIMLEDAGISAGKYTIQFGSSAEIQSEQGIPKFLIKYDVGSGSVETAAMSADSSGTK